MAGPPGEPGDGTAPDAQTRETPTSPDAASTRIEQLRSLLDNCTKAKTEADQLGEKFLSYLLGMAVEETQTAMSRDGVPLSQSE